MFTAVCGQSERSCEEFVKKKKKEVKAGVQQRIRSSLILTLKVRHRKHRTDRTYETKVDRLRSQNVNNMPEKGTVCKNRQGGKKPHSM